MATPLSALPRAVSYDEAMKQAVVELHLSDWVAKRLLITRDA
jgi:hypothetical protein